MTTTYYAAGGGDGTTCRFCGKDLAPTEVGQGICGAPECHDLMIVESGKAILARKREKHDQLAADVFEQVAGDLSAPRAEAPDAVLWMLPAQSDPLEPLPPERLARFREHLEVCAEFAFREPEPAPDADLGSRAQHEPDEATTVIAACSSCQGRCCRDRGGDTALLLATDLNRYRQRNPGATRAQIIDAYLSYLPERSTRDGCVYQAETGCALPREMRQDICNSYYCNPLRWLRQELEAAGAEEAVLVAAHEGTPHRITKLAADGSWSLAKEFGEDAQ